MNDSAAVSVPIRIPSAVSPSLAATRSSRYSDPLSRSSRNSTPNLIENVINSDLNRGRTTKTFTPVDVKNDNGASIRRIAKSKDLNGRLSLTSRTQSNFGVDISRGRSLSSFSITESPVKSVTNKTKQENHKTPVRQVS